MSKKNKTPKRLTIWEEFQEQGLATDGQAPDKIIQFLSIQNARLLGMTACATQEQIDAISDEAAIFFVRFSSIFGDNKKLIRKIEENWPQKPLIFRVAQDVLSLKSWKPIRAKLAKNVLTLADYIFRTLEDRYLTISCGPSEDASQQYQFPKTVPPKDLYSLEACIICTILDAGLASEGSIVFRHGDNEKAQYILEGVVCRKGDFLAIPAESMKVAYETMPDGTAEPDPTVTYRTPPVIFQSPKS